VASRRLTPLLAAALAVFPACRDDAEDPAAPNCLHLPRPPSQDRIALERVLSDIAIEGGVDLLQAPGDGSRWYLVTQAGQIWSFASDGSDDPTVVLDISAQLATGGEAGLLGMAFHPKFAQNGEVFLSYTGPGGPVFTSRISRLRSPDGGRTLDPASEQTILELEQPYSNHNGGHLAFGPDGHLYIGFGDGGSGGDPKGNAQDVDVLLGKFLRLDVDGGDPYAIPADNPFAAGGGRPEIFAWGFRNPWRFSFDRETGALWAGDVGQNLWEEVDLVERGKNYGWNVAEGPVCFEADTCDDTDLVPPVAAYRNTRSASVIAGYVYRGAALPELAGTLLYTDFYGSTIWGVKPGSEPVALAEAGMRGLVAFAEASDGEHYALDYSGGIYKIVAARPATGPGLPERLSATGCGDVADPQQPPAHAIAYDINVPFWSDGADKQRAMVIPAGKTITVGPDGDWDVPPGSTLIKTFHRDGDPIETRLFVRHDDGAWAGYSYAWDADGRDATLLARGETRTIGGAPWIFPDRGECLYCHTEAAGFTLGLETAQLTGAGPDDQLQALVDRGVLSSHPQGDPLPAIADEEYPLEQRARAYFHVNCSQCHRPDAPGGRAKMDLRFATSLVDVAVCDAKPRAGDLDLVDARLVAPGDPSRSVVSARMHTLGTTRMPGLASTVVDADGVALIDAWIAGLTACP